MQLRFAISVRVEVGRGSYGALPPSFVELPGEIVGTLAGTLVISATLVGTFTGSGCLATELGMKDDPNYHRQLNGFSCFLNGPISVKRVFLH